MKKTIFFLSVFMVCMSFAAFSQKSRVGVSGGITFSNQNSEVNGVQHDGRSLTGFMASLVMETPLGKHFAFQPHLAYVRKGMEIKQTNPFSGSDTSIQLRYFDIPLNFLYTTGRRIVFYAGAGPCISLPLPSRRVVKTGDIKTSSELTFGSEPTNIYKGVDYGANILVGIRIPKGFFLSVNYTQGLRNIMPVKRGDDKINNNYLGIQLGYLFSNASK